MINSFVQSITINDLDPQVVKIIRENLELNDLQNLEKVLNNVVKN